MCEKGEEKNRGTTPNLFDVRTHKSYPDTKSPKYQQMVKEASEAVRKVLKKYFREGEKDE